ncbi:MAG: MotA/TolQ/ExbB proton channel family protein [Chitinophagales bacterium]|nr:MotA/TolQ/ExbB proton channel family protein [Chitinophagales bacterium]
MEKSNAPNKKPWVNLLLIKAYQSNPKSVRITGRSPLNIPARTILISFVLAIVLALIIGNLFIEAVHNRIDKELAKVENRQLFDLERVKDHSDKQFFMNQIAVALVQVLLPQDKAKIRDANEDLIESLYENFQGGKITVEGLAKFIEKEAQADSLRKAIIGPIDRSKFTLWLLPQFSPELPDQIARDFKLPINYDEEQGEISPETWKRYLFISAIQLMRDKLDNGIQQPRRLLTALGGPIQWITFIAAIWCLLLLLLLRVPWAKLQSRLIVNKRLPWHPDNKDVWDLRQQEKYFSEIDDTHPRMFTSVRLIKEVINRASSDNEESVYDIIRERVKSFRESVELGEYEIINFLLWATPTFGFIGTIFGIISAMENAAEIFSAATPVEQGIALDKVSGALGTAFDTSFIALIWLVPMSFFLARTRKVEANMFEELEYEATGNLPFQVGAKTSKTTEKNGYQTQSS